MTDEKRGSQPRTSGSGKYIEIAGRESALGKGLLNERAQDESVVAGGYLGHDASVGPVQIHLGGNQRGKKFSRSVFPAPENSDSAFIA